MVVIPGRVVAVTVMGMGMGNWSSELGGSPGRSDFSNATLQTASRLTKCMETTMFFNLFASQ